VPNMSDCLKDDTLLPVSGKANLRKMQISGKLHPDKFLFSYREIEYNFLY
jgi:hypothetical protein